MKYQVQLNNGQIIELSGVEFDPQTFTETLNNQAVLFVNIGGVISNKHLISTIIPVPVVE